MEWSTRQCVRCRPTFEETRVIQSVRASSLSYLRTQSIRQFGTATREFGGRSEDHRWDWLPMRISRRQDWPPCHSRPPLARPESAPRPRRTCDRRPRWRSLSGAPRCRSRLISPTHLTQRIREMIWRMIGMSGRGARVSRPLVGEKQVVNAMPRKQKLAKIQCGRSATSHSGERSDCSDVRPSRRQRLSDFDVSTKLHSAGTAD